MKFKGNFFSNMLSTVTLVTQSFSVFFLLPTFCIQFTIDKLHISSKMQIKQKMNDFACFPLVQDRKPLMIHQCFETVLSHYFKRQSDLWHPWFFFLLAMSDVALEFFSSSDDKQNRNIDN